MKTILTTILLTLAAFAQDTTIHSVTAYPDSGAYVILHFPGKNRDAKGDLIHSVNAASIFLTNAELEKANAKDGADYDGAHVLVLAKRRIGQHRDSLEAKRAKAK